MSTGKRLYNPARSGWLRSPGPASAGSVRIVHPSGALGSSGACGGDGLAAACFMACHLSKAYAHAAMPENRAAKYKEALYLPC